MRQARARLALLWVSQVARVAADHCLRMEVVLGLAAAAGQDRDAVWHEVNVCYYAPFLLLVPLNGALANSLPKRWVMAGAAGWCAAALAAGGFLGVPWLAVAALVGAGAAVYSPPRYALLPAAADDTRVPLPTVNGVIETGGGAAVILGVWLGLTLHGGTVFAGSPLALPVPIAVAVGLNLLGLVTAVPVTFAADVSRPEAPAAAVAGFFRDAARTAKIPAAAGALLGQSWFYALITAGVGALFAFLLETDREHALENLPWYLAMIGPGVAVGSALAGLEGHPTRVMGLVPLGSLGLVGALGWAASGADLLAPSFVLGFLSGLLNVPLRAAFQAAVPDDARGNSSAILNFANYLFTAVMSGFLVVLGWAGVVHGPGQFLALMGLAGVGSFFAWRYLVRDVIELGTEFLLRPCYRVRAHGSGVREFPARGPVVVVCNHTAYLDPLWLGCVVPRRLTPMMTSVFFDRWFLRWLMRDVVNAIRVEWARFRRTAPELDEAVRRLDRGECLVIFPEGWLRRSPEKPLRHFGQGVWHILHQRPTTPVVVCWIEGGWGSFFSYCGGPPGVNKRLDFRRPIDIAVNPPQMVPAAVLENHRAARAFLMQACLDSRRLLGLDPLKAEPPAAGEDDHGE